MPSCEFNRRDLFLEIRYEAVAKLARTRQVALALRLLEFVAQPLEFFLEFLRRAKLLFFGLPPCRHRLRFFLELGDRLFETPETVFRSRVGFLLQSFALDHQLHQIAVDRIELFGLGIDLHAETRRGLIDKIDGLVGQKAIGDVAVRKRCGGDERAIGDAHAVMQLVLLFDAAQDRDRILDRRLADEDRLEAPRKRRVFFDVLPVFIERRRADAMQLPARQRRLQQVAGIHRAFGLSGADDRVQFVDEKNDVALLGLDFRQHGFQTLLEFAAVFGAGNQRAHIERQQASCSSSSPARRP